MLQWKYVAGNNWGICPDGNGAVGCGEQEEFRACSDVAIGKGPISDIPLPKPPTDTKPSYEEPTADEADETADTTEKPAAVSNFFGAIIAMFTFFLVLCTIIAIYVHFYHGDLLKRALRRQQRTSPFDSESSSSISSSSASPIPPPVRPPRIKRLTQTLKDVHNEHGGVTEFSDKRVSEA